MHHWKITKLLLPVFLHKETEMRPPSHIQLQKTSLLLPKYRVRKEKAPKPQNGPTNDSLKIRNQKMKRVWKVKAIGEKCLRSESLTNMTTSVVCLLVEPSGMRMRILVAVVLGRAILESNLTRTLSQQQVWMKIRAIFSRKMQETPLA